MQPTDVEDLLERKIDVCFGHGDQNGDGVLEGADALALAARIVAYLGEPFGSPKALALFQGFETFWAHVSKQFDENGDGLISPEEWRTGLRAGFAESTDDYKASFEPLAVALFAICDKDGDGKVDPGEFAGFHKAFGMSPHQSKIAFDKLDADGNGWLSVEELTAAWQEYYTSRDPDAPGNWLFGDIWDADIWDGTRVKL